MSRQSKHQQSHSITNGFTPGGHIPVGYSYLDRAHSLVTPTRRKLPLGMDSPKLDNSLGLSDTSISSIKSSKSSKSLHHFDSFSSLSSYKSQSFVQQSPSTASRRASLESLRDSPYSGGDSSFKITSDTISDLVKQLPKDPLRWTPSQVAIYLTHVLGLTPKPIVEDVTAYVRNARMGGKQFLRLNEKQLKSEGLNLKWRKLMIEAVKKLRKECLRGNLWNLEGFPTSQEYDESPYQQQEETPSIIKQVNSNSTGTLKRLRDKKAVRMMISSFENIGETTDYDSEDAFVALGGLQKRGSMSSLRSTSSTQSSPIPAVYGEGYVLQRAASYSSLSEEALTYQHHARREFTREQLVDWFGDMSESEVQALADELDEEDSQQAGHLLNRSVSESSINSESCSGESAPPLTPPANAEDKAFNLTPIDADIVKSIVESSVVEEGSEHHNLIVESQFSSALNYVEPLHKDILIDTVSEKDFNNLNLGPRPGASNGGKTNPYRESTYEEEDLEALGLDENRNTFKFDTAKKLPLELNGPAKDSIRIRKVNDVINDNSTANIRELFSSSPFNASDVDQKNEDPSSKSHSISRESSADDIVPPMISQQQRSMGTFGRSALMNALRQQNGNDLVDTNKRAEDESEWGVTFSRKASRRNTLARADGAAALLNADVSGSVIDQTKEGNAAKRMSELFNPTQPLSQANLEIHDNESEEEINEKEEQKEEIPSIIQDKILLPLTTLEPDDDGKGSIRKRSMILVDRRKFEALAKRMGVLEDQLAELESISLPPNSDLGSLRDQKKELHQDQVRNALDRVFTIPPAPNHSDEDDFYIEAELQEEIEEDQGSLQENSDEHKWKLLKRFGIIPSYTNDLFTRFSHPSLDLALGLAAGVGFVLISEVFGRGARH